MFATYTVTLLNAGRLVGSRRLVSRREAVRAADVAVAHDLADTALVVSGGHVVHEVSA